MKRVENGIEFEVRLDLLPFPASPPLAGRNEGEPLGGGDIPLTLFVDRRMPLVEVDGLAEGDYTLTIDGQKIVQDSATEWAKGRRLSDGPDLDQAAQLRQAIILKNRLYFYRWRPQNETYLFGFRKHEQGQNAAEIARFDPLIAEQEARIAELAVPRVRHYVLKKE